MGWVTLLDRKCDDRHGTNSIELNKLKLSRQLRSFQRQSSYEQTIFNNDKTEELKKAKNPLDDMRKERPAVDSEEYSEWAQNYNDAKEDYEAQKLDINDYYDGVMNDLEEEATDEEARITCEQDELEAQLQVMRDELQSTGDGMSTDIQSETIKL